MEIINTSRFMNIPKAIITAFAYLVLKESKSVMAIVKQNRINNENS
jgi:hypothetical protein